MVKVVINPVVENLVKTEKNIQRVDLHHQLVKVRVKEKNGVKKVKMNLYKKLSTKEEK